MSASSFSTAVGRRGAVAAFSTITTTTRASSASLALSTSKLSSLSSSSSAQHDGRLWGVISCRAARRIYSQSFLAIENSSCYTKTTGTTTRLYASSAPRWKNNDENDDDNGNHKWTVPNSITIPPDGIDISFVRSSGAGGQNVNKVNTQVQIRLDVDAAANWIPAEVRHRLKQQQRHRMNRAGELLLQVQEFRTQTANRKAAMERLEDMILQAWSRPKERKLRKGLSKVTKERRKQDKRKRSQVKESRRRVDY